MQNMGEADARFRTYPPSARRFLKKCVELNAPVEISELGLRLAKRYRKAMELLEYLLIKEPDRDR